MPRGRRLLLNKKRMLALALGSAVSLHSVSCGTLIHRDRWWQPRTGVLDPSVVMLDGLGVLVFFVPGAVGFIVDFWTGAIYLPPQYQPYPLPPNAPPPPMTRIQTDPTTLNKEKIESIVREQTGKSIDLDSPGVNVRRVDNVEQASAVLMEAPPPAPK
jgi:hypothetical protein